ncbi:Hypothetical protein NCS54_01498100 [Fusarium falciforme]|uniref:Hypothetical protein n=1 Tax=Fusarium falciforme TaxID=195108 RepID=UPI002301DF9A|nr:Hypothetical protein NCS54_01498100 [Fusarium falciforme]WAO97264.1 Hypothetical protein NCS54_01498100 [Fusarium falciforme]
MAHCRNIGETERQLGQSAPFSVQLLKLTDNRDSPVPPLDTDRLLSLFPASYPTKSDDLVAPSRDVWACIKSELDLQRLKKVHGLLWLTGRLLPPRPLHHQLLLGREILVTEQMDMHLVWTTGRIFVKPIPRFLLEPCLWTKYLCCEQGCECSKGEAHSEGSTQECECRKLWKCALGFLFSYVALRSNGQAGYPSSSNLTQSTSTQTSTRDSTMESFV